MVENAVRLRVMDDTMLTTAAEQYGTPFYIYYKTQLRKNCRDIFLKKPAHMVMPWHFPMWGAHDRRRCWSIEMVRFR